MTYGQDDFFDVEAPILAFDIETAAQSRTDDTPIDIKRIRESLVEEIDQRALGGEGRLPLPEDIGKRLDERDDFGSILTDYIIWLCRQRQAPLLLTGVAPALHPITAHVVQMAFGWEENGTPKLMVQTLGDYGLPRIGDGNIEQVRKAEHELLFWGMKQIVRGRQRKRTLITFNGKDFDLPMCIGRSIALDMHLEPHKVEWGRLTYPWENLRHCDLRMVLAGGKRTQKGTLEAWSMAAGIPVATHGTEVDAWARAGEWDRIKEYGQAEMHTLLRHWHRARTWR